MDENNPNNIDWEKVGRNSTALLIVGLTAYAFKTGFFYWQRRQLKSKNL